MNVNVKLQGYLKKFAPPGSAAGVFSTQLPEVATVEDLLAKLNVDSRHRPVVIINGNVENRETQLHDGDSVHFMPPLAGGSQP